MNVRNSSLVVLLALCSLLAYASPSFGQTAPSNGEDAERGKEIAGVKTVEDSPPEGLPYRLRMSPEATAEKPNKLIIWLHPSTSQKSGAHINETVEAMSPMFLKHGYAVVVFTHKSYADWTAADRHKLVVSLNKIVLVPGIDAHRPILFGFSAGGQLALQLWTKAPPELVGGLVLDAAYPIQMPPAGPGKFSLQPVPDNPTAKQAPILAIVGEKDPGAAIWKKAESVWRKAGVPLEVVYVPDKSHGWLFDQARTDQLERWLTRVAAGELPGKEAAKPEENGKS
jgi:predicted esterase